ncbi:MFS transporter [Paraburkholderia sp.]|uniref:MFS transporter n=1 Tax=Paraburkholderia sp. TaxID=1926495 RepID=UPI00238F0446|nr:MFS transporter [Paraburkholderia sp.]MDE1184753.1 MFS transporter [Paraburkholderia sp.]
MPRPSGRYAALVVAHVAGMIDLVALPVWVGTLMQYFHFDAQRAGMLVTLYLLFAVVFSAFFAPRFDRIRGHRAAPIGFALATAGFFALSQTGSFGGMCVAHALAGAGTGCGLSFAHGAIGRSKNPHRLFAVSHLALALFAVVFLGGAPQVIVHAGGASLFILFAALAGTACIVTAIGFPRGSSSAFSATGTARIAGTPLPAGCWSAIFGIVFMAVNQALVFSFVERIGVTRGFGSPKINAVLIAVGLVNLLPPLLAALLQKRLDARTVAIAGPVAQAVLALTITRATSFAPYAVATALWVFAMIFTHTFLFGLLARIDTTGRAVASTPAMLMAGSAVGPILGGALIVHAGFEAIGIAATVIGAISVLFMLRLRGVTLMSAPLDGAHATRAS